MLLSDESLSETSLFKDSSCVFAFLPYWYQRQHAVTNLKFSRPTKEFPIKDYERGLADSQVNFNKNSISLENAAANLEDDQADDSTVVVQDGYVCVPESSAAANALAGILNQGLNEDLASAVSDKNASAIDPIKVVDHKDVNKWVSYFSVKDREKISAISKSRC